MSAGKFFSKTSSRPSTPAPRQGLFRPEVQVTCHPAGKAPLWETASQQVQLLLSSSSSSHHTGSRTGLADYLSTTTTTAQRYPTLAAQTGRRRRRLHPTDPTDPTCTATATALKLRHFTAVILNNHRPPHTTPPAVDSLRSLSSRCRHAPSHRTSPHLTAAHSNPFFVDDPSTAAAHVCSVSARRTLNLLAAWPASHPHPTRTPLEGCMVTLPDFARGQATPHHPPGHQPSVQPALFDSTARQRIPTYTDDIIACHHHHGAPLAA